MLCISEPLVMKLGIGYIRTISCLSWLGLKTGSERPRYSRGSLDEQDGDDELGSWFSFPVNDILIASNCCDVTSQMIQ